jgi:hypothetical protein
VAIARLATWRQRATAPGPPATTALAAVVRAHHVPAMQIASPGRGATSGTVTASTWSSSASGPTSASWRMLERSTNPQALVQTAISAATEP